MQFATGGVGFVLGVVLVILALVCLALGWNTAAFVLVVIGVLLMIIAGRTFARSIALDETAGQLEPPEEY